MQPKFLTCRQKIWTEVGRSIRGMRGKMTLVKWKLKSKTDLAYDQGILKLVHSGGDFSRRCVGVTKHAGGERRMKFVQQAGRKTPQVGSKNFFRQIEKD